MFSEGKRLLPPEDIVEAIIIVQPVQTILGNENFDIKEIFDYKNKIIKYISVDGTRVSKTSNGNVFIDRKLGVNTSNSYISITPRLNHIVCCGIENEELKAFDVTENKELNCTIAAEEIMDFNGRIFVK